MYAEGHIDVTNDHKGDNIAILSHKRKTKKEANNVRPYIIQFKA